MSSEAVKSWRKRASNKAMILLGSKCVVCGYDKCQRALEVHHIDPTQKKYAISQVVSKPISNDEFIAELKKCTLLCANCHREYHDGMIDVEFTSSFNEDNYSQLYDKCPECNNFVETFGATYCSKKCKGIATRRQQNFSKDLAKSKSIWTTVDVVNLLSRNNGIMTRAAKEVGLSDKAVQKRFKKITGCKNWQEHINSLPVRV